MKIFSSLSHELRTPLTSILGFAKIIHNKFESDIIPVLNNDDVKANKAIDRVRKSIKIMLSEGKRLTELINNVLDLAKLEEGKIEWQHESLEINQIIENAIDAITPLIEDKGLELIKDIDNELPKVYGTKDRLIQVVINLISNAIKFTEIGSIKFVIKKEDFEIKVSISDSGIGLAEENLEAIFEKFKQVGGSTLTDKPRGTGLGLPICRQIIENHGGRIWAESVIGHGSTFHFTLPVYEE